MPRTAIITDTDSSLAPDVVQQYDIRQVPIRVHFGEETYRAVYDLNDAQTFERIDREGKLPTTSAPTIEDFTKAFQDAFDAGYENIICLTVSGEISETHRSALTASHHFPDKEIAVMDTHTLGMAQGFVVLAAAEAAAKNANIENIRLLVDEYASRTHFFIALSTLKYMAMSGRVGHLTAGLAALLDVKPLLQVRHGKLEMVERVRTQQRAWGRLIEMVVSASAGKLIDKVAIMHVNAPDSARELEKRMHDYLPMPDKIIYAELTPGLSIHSGSGAVGIIVVTKQE